MIKKLLWLKIGLPLLLLGSCILLIFSLFSTVAIQSADAASEDCKDQQNNPPFEPNDKDVKSIQNHLFEHLTKVDGLSGAGAAGALACAKRESGFNPQAKNASGGVAGVFQWSGWGNTINGSRITSEGSIKSGDDSTLTFGNQVKLIDFELKNSYAKAREQVGSAFDPKQAAMDWSKIYEGVDTSDSQTKADQIKADAELFYVQYNGSNIPPDIKKAIIDQGDKDRKNNEDDAQEGCDTGGGSGPQVDGIIKMGTYYDALTPEQKKAIGKRPSFSSYPDDPSNAPYGHQCAWYTTFRAKEMGFKESTTAEGNGAVWGQSDPNFTFEVGKPVPHSAVDFKEGQAGRGTCPEGHTAFVEYVNPDGSLIISECNVASGHSGFDRNTATQPEESYATISAKDAKTLTYVTPKK